MERKQAVIWVVSVLLGAFAGYGINAALQPAEEEGIRASAENPIAAAPAEQRKDAHSPLAELAELRQELEEAEAFIRQLQRKASRYDWLRDNGLHADRSMSFNQDSFDPPQKMLDFLGLNEQEAEAMKQVSKRAFEAVRAWEMENAVCVADTATNCVYEMQAAPETLKQDFISDLSALLHEEDLQLLEPAINALYENAEMKQSVAVTFISAEDYAAQRAMQGHTGQLMQSDMVMLKVEQFDESGDSRGSTSSTFGLNESTLQYQWMYKRWNHLFDLDSSAQ